MCACSNNPWLFWNSCGEDIKHDAVPWISAGQGTNWVANCFANYSSQASPWPTGIHAIWIIFKNKVTKLLSLKANWLILITLISLMPCNFLINSLILQFSRRVGSKLISARHFLMSKIHICTSPQILVWGFIWPLRPRMSAVKCSDCASAISRLLFSHKSHTHKQLSENEQVLTPGIQISARRP